MDRVPPLPPRFYRFTGRGTRIHGLLLLAIVLAGAVVVGLTLRAATEQIDHLSRARAEAVEFGLIEFDAEFQRLRLALRTAAANPHPDLAPARLAFDLFQSRSGIVQHGRLFEPVRSTSDFAAASRDIAAFLDRTAPRMEGSDADLIRDLGEIAADAEALADDVHRFTIAGLDLFSSISDIQRQRAQDVLVRMAAILLCVFAGLVVLVIWLSRLLHTSRLNAARILDAAKRHEAIVATSTDGIVLADHDGRIIETNAATQRMFGRGAEALRDMALSDLVLPDPDQADTLLRMFSHASDGTAPSGSERRVELVAATPAGRPFPVEISVNRAEMDRRTLFVVFFRDISKRKAAEGALTAARDRAEAGERSKARFLAVMSHEMRTPLNGLLGSIQLLHNDDLPPEQQECIKTIRTSGRHLLDLVNDVLDLSRLDSGEERVRREPTDPAALVTDVIDTLRPLAREGGIDLGWCWVGEARDRLALDRQRLRQVLVNIVGNAIKFTAEGRVLVELQNATAGDLEIRIADTGIGMSPDDLDRIFDDFERLDASYARRAEGTGLGLGICRRLMTIMGGEIGVESRPGAGSTFTLRLPTEGPRTQGWHDPEPDGDAAGERPMAILVVDDNAVNRFILRAMLQKMGHEVIEAVDARSGIDVIGARPLDLVMMDISMPDMDGMEATRRIRSDIARGGELPIVAVTAHALPPEIAAFEAAGMDAVISKPVERAQLRDVIAHLAGGRPGGGRVSA